SDRGAPAVVGPGGQRPGGPGARVRHPGATLDPVQSPGRARPGRAPPGDSRGDGPRRPARSRPADGRPDCPARSARRVRAGPPPAGDPRVMQVRPRPWWRSTPARARREPAGHRLPAAPAVPRQGEPRPEVEQGPAPVPFPEMTVTVKV